MTDESEIIAAGCIVANEIYGLDGTAFVLKQQYHIVAEQRDEARAAALREAAAIGRAMSLSGCTPGKIWRKLDAMSEQAQPQPADQKRHHDTGPE